MSERLLVILAVLGVVLVLVVLGAIELWSYDWDWKCLVAECRRVKP